MHGPLVPTAEYLGKSGLNAYADFVLQVDGFVGKLDALLTEKGIKDDTILIFTSDNGCSGVADFDRLIAHGHNPSSIFRGKKGDIWEGGAYAIVIPYAEIRSVDYLEDEVFSLGEMLEGVQSRKLWCGRWKNEALGEYELYADPKVKAWAVIQTDSGTTLFNAEDNAMTQKLAEAIRDQLMPH